MHCDATGATAGGEPVKLHTLPVGSGVYRGGRERRGDCQDARILQLVQQMWTERGRKSKCNGQNNDEQISTALSRTG
jgi:hypothetical protein